MSTNNPKSTEENPVNPVNSDHQQDKNENASSGIGLIQTIFSIFAAVFGVQSEQRHKRDFEKGDASNFILGGIIFVILLIATIYFIVGEVLEQAGVS